MAANEPGGPLGGNPSSGNSGGGTGAHGAPKPSHIPFTRIQFATDLLKALGIAKPSKPQLASLLDWMASEGTHAAYNPLAIDGAYEAVYGGTPPGGSAFNTFGHGEHVWNFRDYNYGVSATAKVIAERFPNVLGAIQSGKPAEIISAINGSGWGSHPTVGVGAGTDHQGIGNGTSFFATGYTGDPGRGSIASTGGGTAGSTSYTVHNADGTTSTITVPGAPGAKTAQDYLGTLMNNGVEMTPEVYAFAQQAANQQLSDSAFTYAMYHAPWFAQQFPGIFDKQGRLIESPGQYAADYARFKGIAGQSGQQLTRGQFGYALTRNIDPTTFTNKMQAIQFVETNKATMDQFEQTLKARGLLKGDLTKGEMYKIAMGEAPPVWNAVWEEGYLRGTAANAGLIVGRDITRGLVRNIIKQHPELYNTIQGGGSEAIQQNMYKLAQDLKTTAPASRLYAEGLTAPDLAQLEFGGPQAADIYIRAQQAMANLKAASAPQAATELGAVAQRAGQGSTSTALASGVKQPFETP